MAGGFFTPTPVTVSPRRYAKGASSIAHSVAARLSAQLSAPPAPEQRATAPAARRLN
jgi:hypothetical protein